MTRNAKLKRPLMKFYAFLVSLLFSLPYLFSQEIEDIQTYSNQGIPSIIALFEEHQPHEHNLVNSWKVLKGAELPAGEILAFATYQQFSGSNLVLVMHNQSIWSKSLNEWEQLSSTGLPVDLKVKRLCTYTKYKITRPTGSVFLLSERNKLWHYQEDKTWDSLHQSGIAPGLSIEHINSFQKIKGIGYKSGFLLGMSDQSIYKRTLKDEKWKRMACNQLPKGYRLNSIHSYLHNPLTMGYSEIRIVVTLGDGSIWWTPEKKEFWQKLKIDTLPNKAQIKKIRLFQEFKTARILLLLTDNTIWWYDEENGFSEVKTLALPLE